MLIPVYIWHLLNWIIISNIKCELKVLLCQIPLQTVDDNVIKKKQSFSCTCNHCAELIQKSKCERQNVQQFDLYENHVIQKNGHLLIHLSSLLMNSIIMDVIRINGNDVKSRKQSPEQYREGIFFPILNNLIKRTLFHCNSNSKYNLQYLQ